MAIVAMRRSQIALETTQGTAVAPTRQLAGVLDLENQPGRVLRDERRASLGGPTTYDDLFHASRGSYNGRCLPTEMAELLQAAICIPTVAAPVSTFDQPLTGAELAARPLKSLTGYVGDEAEGFRAAGLYFSRFQISAQDKGVWMFSGDLVGNETVIGATATENLDQTLNTPSLPPILSLMTKLETKATSGGAYSAWVNTVFSWTFTFVTGIVPEYTLGLSLDPADKQRDIATATLEIVAKLNANTVPEYTPYAARTIRYIRVSDGGEANSIEAAYILTGFHALDAERDGTQMCRLTYTAIEDPAWGTGGTKTILKFTVV